MGCLGGIRNDGVDGDGCSSTGGAMVSMMTVCQQVAQALDPLAVAAKASGQPTLKDVLEA